MFLEWMRWHEGIETEILTGDEGKELIGIELKGKGKESKYFSVIILKTEYEKEIRYFTKDNMENLKREVEEAVDEIKFGKYPIYELARIINNKEKGKCEIEGLKSREKLVSAYIGKINLNFEEDEITLKFYKLKNKKYLMEMNMKRKDINVGEMTVYRGIKEKVDNELIEEIKGAYEEYVKTGNMGIMVDIIEELK